MMNVWDEAARKAMLSSAAFPDRFTLARKMSVNDILQTLSDEGGKSDDYLLDFAVKIEPIIAKHFADLRATYDALAELAVHLERAMNDKSDTPDGTAYEIRECRRLLSAPLVVAAIERSKG